MRIKPPHVDMIEPEEVKSFFRGGGTAKVVIANFHEVFDIEEIKTLNGFVIKKLAHFNSIDITVHYMNYFIQYYDEDKSFMAAYCRLKTITDGSYTASTFTPEMFLDLLRTYIMTPETRSRVELMTEDNFCIDYENTEFKGNDSLKFTNVHCKLLMNISVMFKLVIPIVNQYIYLRGLQGDQINDFLTDVFLAIVKVYNSKINIMNKIFAICDSKANTMSYKNSLLWQQLYPIYGKSSDSFMIEKLFTPIIVNIIPKYIYNNSMLSLNKTVIEEAIKGECNWNTTFIGKEVDDIQRDEDGLSNLDKIEINMIKNDESELLSNHMIIKQRLANLISKYGPIMHDEFNYYMENITIDEFQRNMISLIFANHFGSTRILDFIKKHQYIQLVIIMKRMLLKQDYKILPYLLSGRVIKKTRKKIGTKLMAKIEPLYNSILDSKYTSSADIIRDAEIVERMIYILAYSEIEVVDFINEEYRGEVIESNSEIVASEVLRLIADM